MFPFQPLYPNVVYTYLIKNELTDKNVQKLADWDDKTQAYISS